MSTQKPICPICFLELQTDGEIYYSHNEDINEHGWTKDCYCSYWTCKNGHTATQWYDDLKDGKGMYYSGIWNFFENHPDRFWGYSDGDVIVHDSHDYHSMLTHDDLDKQAERDDELEFLFEEVNWDEDIDEEDLDDDDE